MGTANADKHVSIHPNVTSIWCLKKSDGTHKCSLSATSRGHDLQFDPFTEMYFENTMWFLLTGF